MTVGDGARAANRARNVRQAKAEKRRRAMREAEQREREQHTIWQARLKQEFLERQERRAS